MGSAIMRSNSKMFSPFVGIVGVYYVWCLLLLVGSICNNHHTTSNAFSPSLSSSHHRCRLHHTIGDIAPLSGGNHNILHHNSRLAASTVTTGTTTPFSSSDDDNNNNNSNQNSSKGSSKTTMISDAAEWHRQRRKAMIQKYGDQILSLERNESSQWIGLPLLVLANLSLLSLSIYSANLSIPAVVLLSIFPGSMFSLWQLQILHDCLHGSLFTKGQNKIGGMKRSTIQDRVLFWGSLPSVFGYYLYLKFGHLSHHSNVGDPSKASLAKLFDSDQVDFEDGDVLFVAHRMNLLGKIGPTFQLPFNKTLTMSISKSGFNSWIKGKPIWNSLMFTSSFMFERFMLVINDAVVSLAGKNFFFPNKPDIFHKQCTYYARCATALRLILLLFCGWKSLLFLYLSETLWSIPPHPAAAMFVTNHPSSTDSSSSNENGGGCIPSMSTYAGTWYSLFTLGTNYHCEHHDFPTIPLNKLAELRKIAPEFYRSGSNDNIFEIMHDTFAEPDFYACMNTNNIISPTATDD